MAVLTRLLMMFALSALLATPCFAAQAKGIAQGFGTATWGEDVSKRQGFMKIRSDEGIDYFVSLRESYEMKGYGKPTVFYGQTGGKLYAVHLRLNDDTGYDRLVAELRKLYGPGKKTQEGDTSVVRWKAGPVLLKLKRDQASGMKLSFYYQPVAATLPLALREAEPTSEDLARMLPSEEMQVKVPAGALPPKQEEYVGIDVLKFLRQGGTFIKQELKQ